MSLCTGHQRSLRQRGVGLLTLVVGALALTVLAVAVMSQLRNTNTELESRFAASQRALAAVNALRAALAECVLNYPMTSASNPQNIPRATYVLFDLVAATGAASSATLPAKAASDVDIGSWSSSLYCPGRNASGVPQSLWINSSASGFVRSDPAFLSVALRMGSSTAATPADRPGSLYLVVGCGTDGNAIAAKALLRNMGVAIATVDSFACAAPQEILLAP